MARAGIKAFEKRQAERDSANDTVTMTTPTELQTPINSAALAPVKPITIPDLPPPSGSAGLQGAIQANVEATQAQQAKADTAQGAKDTSLQQLIDSLSDSKGQTQLQDTFYRDTVDPAEAELRDINQQLVEEQRSLDNQLRNLEDAGGGLTSGMQVEKQRLINESTRRQADLSVIQMAKQGRYDSAKAIADRAVTAQLEGQAQKNQILSLIYQDSKDQFTKEEQRAFESAQADRERAYTNEKETAQQISDLSLNALQNGAPTGVALSIRNANTMDEAISASSGYLATPSVRAKGGDTVYTVDGNKVTVPTFEEWIAEKEQEERQSFTMEKRESFRDQYESEMVLVNDASKIANLTPFTREMLKNPKNFFTLTPTEKSKVLKELASAEIDTAQIQEGKRRPLSATQADDLVQAQIARAGIVNLKSMLDKLDETGPVIGALRQANPYDPQVVAIMAEISRIVPGLARGVFKEVGVLTDTDIDRYTRTLANPSATREQIEQLHEDTMRKIDQSLSLIGDTYDALGYDLGTFDVNAGTSDNLSDDEAYAAYLKSTNQ